LFLFLDSKKSKYSFRDGRLQRRRHLPSWRETERICYRAGLTNTTKVGILERYSAASALSALLGRFLPKTWAAAFATAPFLLGEVRWPRDTAGTRF
jgi:hypothetical protein